MFTFEQYISPEFLNVFVDAGVKGYEVNSFMSQYFHNAPTYKKNMSSSGVMIYRERSLVFSGNMILKESTNNIGELLALYLGIKKGIELKREINEHYSTSKPSIKYINIFSDSAYSVNCVTEWFKNWIFTRNNQMQFIGTNGKPVKNQELIESIIRLVLQYEEKINLIKVRGHQDPNKEESVELVSKYLETANDIFKRQVGVNNFYNPTKEVVRDIIRKNNAVDWLAGSCYPTAKHILDLPTIDDIFPMYLYTITPNDYNVFLSLTQNQNIILEKEI